MQEFLAKTLFGLEEVLAEELRALGASGVQVLRRAVSFKGDQELLYKCNLELRTALKILKPIASFQIHNDRHLYKKMQSIRWSELFGVHQTFAIDAVTYGEVFRHSKFAALKTKDAIVDQFRDQYGERPSVNTEDPDLRISVHIAEKDCTVSLDSTGIPLSKRGYKLEQTRAPLSEVLAAGMLILTGWDRARSLIDPMCGSGTIAIEAAMMAAGISPGRKRSFAFEKWNDFDGELWAMVKKEAKKNEGPVTARIMGYDLDQRAIEIARGNAERAGVSGAINFRKQDFLSENSEGGDCLLVINPPYGERLENEDDMIPLYQEIGTKMKHSYNGCDAWIISSNLRALKFVGLRPSKKIKLFNGPLECRFQHYELFKGSRKDSRSEA